MKESQKSHFLIRALFLLTAFLSIGWADSWDGLKTSAGKVTSVKAEFTQEKHMKILTRPLVSGGILLFQSPDSLRWEYKYPFKSILLLHDGRTKRYVEKDGSYVEDATANLQSMQMVVQEITQWLNGRFEENPAFIAKLESGRKILLVPKAPSFAKVIERIELLLGDRPAIIKSVLIYESQDSFTKLEFENVTLNQKLDDALFRKS